MAGNKNLDASSKQRGGDTVLSLPEADLNRWCADLVKHMDNMNIDKPTQLAIMHGAAAAILPDIPPKARALAVMAHVSAMLISAGIAVDSLPDGLQ